MLKNSKMFLLTFSITCIAIFWGLLNFPFEIPDEQSHYATVNFLAEERRMPEKLENNLSYEEQEVEYLFGIMTDGTNKYAHNPEYKPEFTTTITGKYQEDIRALNTQENRTSYTISQAAIYPPLYYWVANIFHDLSYESDIITRLFTTRIVSLIFVVLTALVAYKMGILVYKNTKYALTLLAMTVLFPMTSYLGGAVNSDNLHNLLFAAFTLICLRVIKSGIHENSSLQIGIFIGLGLITKPQAYIMIPIYLLSVLLSRKKISGKTFFNSISTIAILILLIAGWQEVPKFIEATSLSSINPYAIGAGKEHGGLSNFLNFSKEFLLRIKSEVIVWYWGIFKWSNLIMPRPIWWIANRIVVISALGIFYKFFQDFRSKKFSSVSRTSIFFILANIIYLLAIFWFDWQYYQLKGSSFGIQARYFMPLLIPQLILIHQGLINLAKKSQHKIILTKLLLAFFVLLQIVAVYTVASGYYDLSSLNSFIVQASQYKPWYAKGNYWLFWIGAYFLSLLYIIYSVILGKTKK